MDSEVVVEVGVEEEEIEVGVEEEEDPLALGEELRAIDVVFFNCCFTVNRSDDRFDRRDRPY